MISMGQNGEFGQLHTKKPYHGGTPETTDRSYTVRRCGSFWEVRCVTRAHARVTGDQLVAAWPTEQEAEAMARDLADPEAASRRGKRTLEDMIGESE